MLSRPRNAVSTGKRGGRKKVAAPHLVVSSDNEEGSMSSKSNFPDDDNDYLNEDNASLGASSEDDDDWKLSVKSKPLSFRKENCSVQRRTIPARNRSAGAKRPEYEALFFSSDDDAACLSLFDLFKKRKNGVPKIEQQSNRLLSPTEQLRKESYDDPNGFATADPQSFVSHRLVKPVSRKVQHPKNIKKDFETSSSKDRSDSSDEDSKDKQLQLDDDNDCRHSYYNSDDGYRPKRATMKKDDVSKHFTDERKQKRKRTVERQKTMMKQRKKRKIKDCELVHDRHDYDDSDSSSQERYTISDLEQAASARRQRTRVKRLLQEKQCESEEEESPRHNKHGFSFEVGGRRQTPKRLCVRETNERIATIVKESDAIDCSGISVMTFNDSASVENEEWIDDSDDISCSNSDISNEPKTTKNTLVKSSRTKSFSPVDDDDDDFVVEDETDEDGEEPSFMYSSLGRDIEEVINDSPRNRSQSHRPVKIGYVHDNDKTLFDDNASSSNSENATSVLPLNPTEGKQPLILNNDVIYATPGSRQTSRDNSSLPTKTTTPRLYQCFSKTDEITKETIPPLHVCCPAPNGHSRHCFALQTLYRASLLSGSRKYKNDGSLALLQPPHFRTVMDDDLLDQIANRFGRKALVIEESTIYKKEMVLNTRAELNSVFGVDSANLQLVDFCERFQRYLSQQMGSADIYCCPLCYTEADRRLNDKRHSDDDSSSDTARNDSNTESNDDDESITNNVEMGRGFNMGPMTVLGSLDNDKFEIASKFCFRLISSVKAHLQRVHDVDLSILSGNDLFKRFQIRTQDGLLQRHLKEYWQKQTFQGDMRRYWAEGHSQSFVYLLQLIVQRNEGCHYFKDKEDFCRSFPNRARKLWDRISKPYEKETEGALDDFVVDEVEDESSSGDDHPPPIPDHTFETQQQVDPEEQMIQTLRAQRMKIARDDENDVFTSSADDDSGLGSKPKSRQSRGKLDSPSVDESDDFSQESIPDLPGYYFDKEEEDDWMKSKRRRFKSQVLRRG